ncbi:hypothetical protein GWK47_042058 [Chionoecetes opilio]|uniref:Uncharacterized protein n=1 Tax=Chionoecetes opilio TaxID=41210 RepID=A0A8J4YI17_CHIOP|nr:hypothetical protein GWK47_042058 [Chionoecetes opilio]
MGVLSRRPFPRELCRALFSRRRQFLASEEVVRHVRFPSRFPRQPRRGVVEAVFWRWRVRGKLGAGATRGKHADGSLRLSVWGWVGGRSCGAAPENRPDIPPQLAEGGVLRPTCSHRTGREAAGGSVLGGAARVSPAYVARSSQACQPTPRVALVFVFIHPSSLSFIPLPLTCL